MDDKIKRKMRLMFVYMFSALIPVIGVFIYFYQNMYEKMESEILIVANQNLARMSDTIDKEVGTALELINRIYLNRELYTILDTHYASDEEFFCQYQDRLYPSLKILNPLSSSIKYHSVYSDNPTILGGNFVNRLEESFWANTFQDHNQNSIIMHSYAKQPPTNQEGYMFSILSRMDLFKNLNAHKKLIRVDFELNFFENIVANGNFKGTVYIVDDSEMIIFSNSDAPNHTKYVPPDDEATSRYFISHKISTLWGWQIIGIADVAYIKSSLMLERNSALFLLILSVSLLLIVVYKLVTDIQKGHLRERQIELEKKQAQLHALHSQVNPHFLFNVLETIRMRWVLEGKREHSAVILRMAKMYREAIMWQDDMITVKKEIAFIKEFMFIQDYRYGDRLEWRLQVDENIMDFKVPKMMLQTFIDNACVHGIAGTKHKAEISLMGKRKDNFLYFRITDNGAGFTAEKEAHFYHLLKGEINDDACIGIQNLARRLKLYYGDSFQMTLDTSQGKGAAIEIILPIDSF